MRLLFIQVYSRCELMMCNKQMIVRAGLRRCMYRQSANRPQEQQSGRAVEISAPAVSSDDRSRSPLRGGEGRDLNVVCFSGIRAPVLCILSGLRWERFGLGVGCLGQCGNVSGFFPFPDAMLWLRRRGCLRFCTLAWLGWFAEWSTL